MVASEIQEGIEVIEEEKDHQEINGENFENSSTNQGNTTSEEIDNSLPVKSKNSPAIGGRVKKFGKKSMPNKKHATRRSNQHLYCKKFSK